MIYLTTLVFPVLAICSGVAALGALVRFVALIRSETRERGGQ
jgi:hypothetical protein